MVAVAATTESGIATPPAPPASNTAVTADAKIGPDAQVGRAAPGPPEPEEIQRRRELVRKLFNDFWSGCDDKPAAFVDRLNQAESYLNERLTAHGEVWQLDAKTRKMLGLPPRSNSRSTGGSAGRH